MNNKIRAFSMYSVVIAAILALSNYTVTAQTIGLHVAENHSVIFGEDAFSVGAKFMWFPDSKALRVGVSEKHSLDTAAFNHWTPIYFGENSTAFGNSSLASGELSMAWGEVNYALANRTTAWGQLNRLYGPSSTVWGSRNMTGSYGLAATVWGSSNSANGRLSTVWGLENFANSSVETVFGLFADTLDNSNPILPIDTDHLFVIGNGSSSTDRNNALTILKNGATTLNPKSTVSTTLQVKGGTYAAIQAGSAPYSNSFGVIGEGKTGIFGGAKGDDSYGIYGFSPSTATNSFAGFFKGDLKIEDNADNTDWTIYVDSADDINFAHEGVLRAYIADGSGSFSITSDRRLKNNIKTLDTVLDRVNQLRPSSYRYTHSKSNVPSIGFIAQEVEKVFPDLVHEKDGIKTLAYDDFAILSIKAIQEQQEIIDALKKETEDLKEANLNLTERLNKLEKLILEQNR